MRNLLLLLCGFLVLCGCKKPGDGKTHPNPQLVQAFSFQPGTYWIYYDSVTGFEDSMYVERNQYFNNDRSVSNAVTLFIIAPDSPQLQYYILGIDENFVSLGQPRNQILLFSHPLTLGIVRYSDTSTVKSIRGDVSVSGQIIDSVTVIEYSSHVEYSSHYIQTGQFYVKENVGFVKIEVHYPTLHIDHNYNLVRYHIVK